MVIQVAYPHLLIKQLIDWETFTYTYLVVDPETNQGVLIDPVKEQVERDLALVKELGVELLYVLETHVHADHITSAGMIRQKSGAKIVYSDQVDIRAIDIAVADGQRLPLGKQEIKAIATPGHTNGCVSYYIDGAVFTGDALLIRGCGRTDFQQGNANVLYHSITTKLFTLPEETVVYPGHDYNGRTSSSIAEEKRWNARLGDQRSEEEFVEIMKNLNLDLPKKINEAVPANMGCGVNFDPRQYLYRDFSISDLHDVWESLADDEVIVDNRSAEEYKLSHIPGAINIPFGSEEQHLDELKKFSKIYIYCRSGRRAQTAFTTLTILGLDNVMCVGHSGIPEWISAGYPLKD